MESTTLKYKKNGNDTNIGIGNDEKRWKTSDDIPYGRGEIREKA